MTGVPDREPLSVVRIADDDVDEDLDVALRRLLSTCFTKPGDEIFRTRRYFERPPAWRWIIHVAGRPAAHLAAHDVAVGVGPRACRVLGVAEVCVEPSSRGLGLVRAMLAAAHEFGVDRRFDFAMLFGRPEIYRSSGYRRVDRAVHVVGPDST